MKKLKRVLPATTAGFNVFEMLSGGTSAAVEAKQMSLAAEEKSSIPPIFIGGLECVHSRGVRGYKGCAAALVRPTKMEQLSAYGLEVIGKLLATQRVMKALGIAAQIRQDVELPVQLDYKAPVRPFQLPGGWDMGVSVELLQEAALEHQDALIAEIAANQEKMVESETFYEVVDFCHSSRPEPVRAPVQDGALRLEPGSYADRSLRRMLHDAGDRNLRTPKDGVYEIKWLKTTMGTYPHFRISVETLFGAEVATCKSFRSRRNQRLLPKNVREIDDLLEVRMIVTDYDATGDNTSVAYEVAIPARDNPDPEIRQLVSQRQVVSQHLGFPKLSKMRPSWSRVFAENFAGIPAKFGMSRSMTNMLFAASGEAFRFRLATLPNGQKKFQLPRPDHVLMDFQEILADLKDQPCDPAFKSGLEAFVSDLERDVPYIRAHDGWVRDYLVKRAAAFLPEPENGGHARLKAGDIPGLQEEMNTENFWHLWPLLLNFNAPQIHGWDATVNNWLALMAGTWPATEEPEMVQPYRYAGEVVEELFSIIDRKFMPEDEVEVESTLTVEDEVEMAVEAAIKMESASTPLAEVVAEMPEVAAAAAEMPEVVVEVEPEAAEVAAEMEPLDAEEEFEDDFGMPEYGLDDEVENTTEPAMDDAVSGRVEAMAQEALTIMGWSWSDTTAAGLYKLAAGVAKAINRAEKGDSPNKEETLARLDLGLELIAKAVDLATDPQAVQ